MTTTLCTARSVHSGPHDYPDLIPGASLLLSFALPSNHQPWDRASPATTCFRRTVLVIGSNRVAMIRARTCLEAGYQVVHASLQDDPSPTDPELRFRSQQGQITECLTSIAETSESGFTTWLTSLPCLNDISFVIYTATSMNCRSTRSPSELDDTSLLALRKACFTHRLLLNVADEPGLSDFSFPVSHRWPTAQDTSHSSPFSSQRQSRSSPLQLAISSSASSCRLAVRLKREIVSKVSPRAGEACEAIAKLRQRARAMCEIKTGLDIPFETDEELLSSGAGPRALNKPMPPLTSSQSHHSVSTDPGLLSSTSSPSPSQPAQNEGGTSDQTALSTRMRWISQISEYWPLDQIADLARDDDRMTHLLALSPLASTIQNKDATHSQVPSSEPSLSGTTPTLATRKASTPALEEEKPLDGIVEHEKPKPAPSHHESAYHEFTIPTPTHIPPPRRGRILLVGSGLGHPGLLTVAAHTALTHHATVVLSDKLVPAPVLALIPKSIPLYIAKKYPGNAESAQDELMHMALDAAKRGETVVRLKQGDPFLYGRGGEEVLFFRQHGFECCIIPGVSSALAGATMACIPVTQRGVSETVMVCTGVGRGGKRIRVPGYERNRTLVMLMSVARLAQVIDTLIQPGSSTLLSPPLQSSTQHESYDKHHQGQVSQCETSRNGEAYPSYLPIAIIERASSPDQRIVATTLDRIREALDQAGEQRPPGMMVIGWSVLALQGHGDVMVLDGVQGMNPAEVEAVDRRRVERWLGRRPFIVKEGLSSDWDQFGPLTNVLAAQQTRI